MDDAVGVSVFERRANLDRDLDDSWEFCWFCFGETWTGDQFHHEKRETARFADVVDRDDMRVVEGGGGACFADQSFATVAGLARGGEDFDGDFAMELEIGGAIDRAHAAASEFAVEAVTIAQDGAQRRDVRAQIVGEELGLLRVEHVVKDNT